jgi:hypothetical protein
MLSFILFFILFFIPSIIINYEAYSRERIKFKPNLVVLYVFDETDHDIVDQFDFVSSFFQSNVTFDIFNCSNNFYSIHSFSLIKLLILFYLTLLFHFLLRSSKYIFSLLIIFMISSQIIHVKSFFSLNLTVRCQIF